MDCMDSEESVKGSQAAPTRAPLTDSSESGTRFSDGGKGALVQADDCSARSGGGLARRIVSALASLRTTRFSSRVRLARGGGGSEAPFEKLDQVYCYRPI